jgi:hypothetical protein
VNRRIAGRRRGDATQDDPAQPPEADDVWTDEDALLAELDESATRLRRFGRFYEVVAVVSTAVLAVVFTVGDIAVVADAVGHHDRGAAIGALVALPAGLFLIYAMYVASALIGTFVRTYAVARLLDVERS